MRHAGGCGGALALGLGLGLRGGGGRAGGGGGRSDHFVQMEEWNEEATLKAEGDEEGAAGGANGNHGNTVL